MKIGFNPHAAAQAQSARPPHTQTTPPASAGTDDGVTITLSQAAQSILKNGSAEYSGNSPAHQARAAMLNIADGNQVDGLAEDNLSKPFGQLVKMFAHAKHTTETTEAAPPVDGGDVGGITEPTDGGDVGGITEPTDGGDTTVTDGANGGTGDTGTTDGGDTTVTDSTDGGTGDTGTTDGGDTTVADGSGGTGDTGTTEGDDTTVVAAPADGEDTGIGDTDPTVVVEEPDIAELLDDTAPSDGETTEPDTGMAGSGDAVATDSSGSGDTGATESAPAVVVDADGLTDELIDLLNENSEEVV